MLQYRLVVPVLFVVVYRTLFPAFGFAGVDQIISTWDIRSQNINSIRFQYSGVSYTPEGYVRLPKGPHPNTDRTIEISGELLFDTKKKRIAYNAIDEVATNVLSGNPAWVPRHIFLAYDQNYFYMYHPRSENFSVDGEGNKTNYSALKISKELRDEFCRVEQVPLLLTSSLIALALGRRPESLNSNLNDLVLRIETESSHEGHPCYVLKSPPNKEGVHSELWVDKKDHNKIYRLDQYLINELMHTCRIQYQDSDFGSIPKSWQVDRYSLFEKGKVIAITVTLDSYEINPKVSISDFQVVPPPGTPVYDDTLPVDAQRYVVPEPGQPPLPVEEVKLQEEASDSAFSRKAVIVGIVAACSLVSFFLVRNLRKQVS